ncbi:MAG: hypothetical protein DHS20C17_32130 [Cyclobacteriaceae bacterium]|nr:MAG: hypothetical protein DHS20C17_32130 [Cyclobacteriaceae bacterium]
MAEKTIKRAVIMLDQSSGELREDDDAALGIDLWPEVEKSLETLVDDGIEVMLTVPSNESTEDLQDLSSWVPGLNIVAIPKTFSYIKDEDYSADMQLQAGDDETAFVSGDRRMRGDAAQAGFKPAPHAALLPMMAKSKKIEAVRLTGPRDALWKLGQSEEVVPMYFQPVSEGTEWALIALVSNEVQVNAVMRKIKVQALPYDPMTEDLIWARIDSDNDETRSELSKRKVLHAEPGQVLLAMKPYDDAQALNIHGGHGHSELLLPDPNLLRAASRKSIDRGTLDINKLPKDILEKVKIDPVIRDILIMTRPCCSTVTEHYEDDLDRYTGVTNLDSQGVIISRHSVHPDNKRVESALLADLRAMGYCPYRHNFTHAGQTHSNIIADLPGNGILRIKAHILEKYRKVLRRRPFPRPLRRWQNEMTELVNSDWFQSDELRRMPDWEIRRRVEKIFRLQPWYPWWKKLCLLYTGFGADIVIVGCHLDSTAGFEPGYSAPTDAAPGRDDNGSGLAATLSMARYFHNLKGKLTHTVRFCFFNAEESGLVGSKAYAAKMKSLNAPIRATVCTDMMGHNSDANHIFEVHAGYTDPVIRDLSLPIASEVESAAAAYGQLAPAQIYRGTSWSGAPDRDVYDGGINRSDHAAFHQQGYGAVLVSEDFFTNFTTEPSDDPNPNYHRQSDNFIDLEYAKNITCAINKAVINLAI